MLSRVLPLTAALCLPLTAALCLPLTAALCLPLTAALCLPLTAALCLPLTAALCLLWAASASAAVIHYVNLNSPGPVSPFTSWAAAATNIQDAIDASTNGDTVLVTNGLYATGGRPVNGFHLTNRVAVTKPITVQSVNGPSVTIIQGYQIPGITNGDASVRCAYLTNGAGLTGFTLTGGGSRGDGGAYYDECCGGGVWCQSASALIAGCTISSNTTFYFGGGAYQGTFTNCIFSGNTANEGGAALSATLESCLVTGNSSVNEGGGAYDCTVINCKLTGNSTSDLGGGAWYGALYNSEVSGNLAGRGGGVADVSLYNCTVTGNSAIDSGGAYGGASYNSIIYYNAAALNANYGPDMYGDIYIYYTCSTPLPGFSWNMNISAEPQLATSSHLSPGSPCRGAGNTNYASGADVDGQAWANPPSMGCDEPAATTGLLNVAIIPAYTNLAAGFSANLTASILGQTSASQWDFGDGTILSNRPYAAHVWNAPGDYPVVLKAFNDDYPGGVSATLIVHVVAPPVCYVAIQSPNPVAPYASWATAATNIQDAVDAASIPGSIVLVTNGVYQTGARLMNGALSNRLVVAKPVNVQSVNGPAVTVIRGNPVIGDSAVRCVYMTNSATRAGFTLANGATRAAGDQYFEQSGGGAFCASMDATLLNCLLVSNSAFFDGGAIFGGTLNNSVLTGNSAQNGGGASIATLRNCALYGNSAQNGGGMYAGTLNNCTLAENSAYDSGGAFNGTLNNCICYYNSSVTDNANYNAAYQGTVLNFSCTTPLPSGGSGNVTNEPLLADLFHLNAGSPCIGAGSAAYANGTDLDGDVWASPPSLGCDEFVQGGATGPLSASVQAAYTNVAVGFAVDFTALISGHANASRWDFGGGIQVSNRPVSTHGWPQPGDYPVTFTAYNTDNPGGVSASVTVHVVTTPVHYVALQSTHPVAPYSSWATAAATIQDAVDAASIPGALILVTNGVYQTGGRLVHGFPTNRLAITKPVTVQGVNGPGTTVILGYQSPPFKLADDAMRCVYLTNGAALVGFTLTGGATRGDYGASAQEANGGGAWCESSRASISGCVMTGNLAFYYGGGVYSGTLCNCTITGNTSDYYGGGFSSSSVSSVPSVLNNCIVYYNNAFSEVPGTENYDGGIFHNSCTTADPGGIGNITNAPLFLDQAGGNFHLQSNSPCINAGDNSCVTTSLDLDDLPRIIDGIVDMGAYEYPTLFNAWLQQYGLATDGSADFLDPDHDGMNNWQEWLAGTDPTNASSLLLMLNPTGGGSNIVVTWQNVTNHTYYLQRNLGLSMPSAFLPLATNLIGLTGTTSYTDTNAAGPGPFFYRVGVQ